MGQILSGACGALALSPGPLILSSVLEREHLLPGGAMDDRHALMCDGDVFPVWHPMCDGINADDGLLLRLGSRGSPDRETLLTGLEARLWCACGGDLSERGLVQMLVAERCASMGEAARLVGDFLYKLTRGGFLLLVGDPVPESHPDDVIEWPSTIGVLQCRHPIGSPRNSSPSHTARIPISSTRR
jgi:hypothetical protein